MNLKQLRKKTGLTQTQFSRKVGLHKQFISNIERGLCPVPTKYFPKIARVCKVSIDDLINMNLKRYEKRLRMEVLRAS